MSEEFEDGWILTPSPTYPTDGNAMDNLYYFGLILPDGHAPLDIPLQMNINVLEQFGQYFFDLIKGDIVIDREAIRFVPVNGLFLWWFYGKVTHAGGGVFTVTNMDGTTRKPTLATWQKSAAQHLYQNGVVTNDYVIEWVKGGFLKAAILGKGLDHGEGAATPAYTFPDSIDTMFDVIDTLTWNGGDLFASLWRMSGAQTITPIPGNNGFYQEIADMTPSSGAMTVQCTATNGEAMMADFLAGTKRDIVFKIIKSKDNTLYMELTATNAMIGSCIPLRIIGQPTIWTVVFAIGAVSWEIKDGTTTLALWGL